MKQIRILLADDHNVMRRGLRLLLEGQPEFTVVAEAADGRQAIEQAEATSPDVVVLERGLYDPATIGRKSPETQDISIDQVRTLVLADDVLLDPLKHAAQALGYALR